MFSLPTSILSQFGDPYQQPTPEKEKARKSVDDQINYKRLLEDYKTKYAQKIQKMTDDHNWKLKEMEMGFETRLAEIKEEYANRITQFK